MSDDEPTPPLSPPASSVSPAPTISTIPTPTDDETTADTIDTMDTKTVTKETTPPSPSPPSPSPSPNPDHEPSEDEDSDDEDENSVEARELLNSKLNAYRLQVNDLDRQLLKAQSEASINAELESRARKRQLDLEKEVSDCREEIKSLHSTNNASTSALKTSSPTKSRNMGPAFGATAELVLRLRAENTSLRDDLKRALEAAQVAASAAKAAQQPGSTKGSEGIDALEYAMHRDEQMSKLTTKNFELFHQVEQTLEECVVIEAKVSIQSDAVSKCSCNYRKNTFLLVHSSFIVFS